MSKISRLLLIFSLLISAASQAQVYPDPSTSWGIYPRRGVFDYTLYGPTGCGVPTDSTFLNSSGFGYGQIMPLFAMYFDSCGHHGYFWDPSLKNWHRCDSSGSGSGTVTGVFLSNDSLYYSTSSGNHLVMLAIAQPDSTVKYVTPTQLALRRLISDTSGINSTATRGYVGKVRDSLAAVAQAALADTADSLRAASYPLYPRQGLSPLGTHDDTLQLGGYVGTFFQPDTIYTAGYPFLITGLPTTSDTSSHKPIAMDGTGKLFQETFWPGSGNGGSGYGIDTVARDSIAAIQGRQVYFLNDRTDPNSDSLTYATDLYHHYTKGVDDTADATMTITNMTDGHTVRHFFHANGGSGAYSDTSVVFMRNWLSSGLQAMVTYAQAHHKNMVIDTNYTLPSGVTVAAGWQPAWHGRIGDTLFYTSKTGSAISVLYGNSNLVFDGITFANTSDTSSIGNNCLNLEGFTSVAHIKGITVHNCTFIDFFTPLLLKGVDGADISDNHFRHYKGRLLTTTAPATDIRTVVDSVGDEVKNLKVHDNMGDGCSGCTVATVIETGGPMDGFWYGPCSSCAFYDNSTSNYGQEHYVYQPNIQLIDSAASSIHDNQINGNLIPGWKTPSGGSITSVVGIRAEGQHLSIENNRIWHSTIGILSYATGSWNYQFRGIVIKNNTIWVNQDTTSNPTKGIQVQGYSASFRSKGPVIENNTIYVDSVKLKTTFQGISLTYSDSGSVKNNTIQQRAITRVGGGIQALNFNTDSAVAVNNNNTKGVDTVLMSTASSLDSSQTIPSQPGKQYKALVTNGTNLSWGSPNEWIDVRSINLVGDSTTDNSSALQHALDSLNSLSNIGRKLVFPYGVYIFHSTVHTHPNQRVIFEGSGSNYYTTTQNPITKLIFTSATTDFFSDSANGTTWEDMDLVNSTTPTAGSAINNFGQFLHLENCSFSNFYIGTSQQNATYSYIRHCTFTGQKEVDIFLADAANPDQGDATITDCNFNNGYYGIFQTSSGGSKILNCKCNAGSGTPYFTFIRTFINPGSNSTSDLFISNCSIENFSNYGVDVETSGGGSFGNITITGGNISSFHGGTAINLFSDNITSFTGRASIVGTQINNCATALVATNVYNIDDYSNVDRNSVSSPYSLTGVVNYFNPKTVASDGSTGLVNGTIYTYLDSLYGGNFSVANRLTALLDTAYPISAVTYVQDNFAEGSTTDMAGTTPAPTGIGAWSSVYGGVTLGRSSGVLYCPTSGTVAYTTSTGVHDAYTEYVVLSNASLTSGGQISILGNFFSSTNYLALSYNGTAFNIYEYVSGSLLAVTPVPVNVTLANGDTIKLVVTGKIASAYKNSTLICSGNFSNTSLTGTLAGIYYYNNIATTMSRFTVTNIPFSGGYQYGINHDSTLTGQGTKTSPLSVATGAAATFQQVLTNGATLNTNNNIVVTGGNHLFITDSTGAFYVGAKAVTLGYTGFQSQTVVSGSFGITGWFHAGGSSSGSTVTLLAYYTNNDIDPSSTLASYTLVLPAGGTAYDGEEERLYFGGTITSGTVVTSLTISPGSGNAIIQNSATTSASAGDQLIYTYRALTGSTGYWYKK